MSRDVRERPGDGLPDDPRAGLLATRALAAGLAVVGIALIAGALAGCGGGGGGSGTASGSTFLSTSLPATTSTTTTTTPTTSEGLPRALGSDRAVRTAVEAVLTSGDPAEVCGKYVTTRYLKNAYGGKQGCLQAQQPGSAAKSLRSFQVVNSGGQGTIVAASATPNGGPYDGSKLGIVLIFDTDHYQVDALHSNVPVGP